MPAIEIHELPGAGIVREPMLCLEGKARALGCRHLTLDSRTVDDAERLHAGPGHRTAGVTPQFARAQGLDRLDATTCMDKPI